MYQKLSNRATRHCNQQHPSTPRLKNLFLLYRHINNSIALSVFQVVPSQHVLRQKNVNSLVCYIKAPSSARSNLPNFTTLIHGGTKPERAWSTRRIPRVLCHLIVPASLLRFFSLHTKMCISHKHRAESTDRQWGLQYTPYCPTGVSCMTYTIRECIVQNFWLWTEELSETCRVLFQK
jgi:hypothetical protein